LLKRQTWIANAENKFQQQTIGQTQDTDLQVFMARFFFQIVAVHAVTQYNPVGGYQSFGETFFKHMSLTNPEDEGRMPSKRLQKPYTSLHGVIILKTTILRT
jgi:hypothetical protein